MSCRVIPCHISSVIRHDMMCISMSILILAPCSHPSIYYQSRDTRFHYIASSFTSYWHLMMMHVGIPHWYLSYAHGWDPVTEMWIRTLIPQRWNAERQKREHKQEKHTTHTINLSQVDAHARALAEIFAGETPTSSTPVLPRTNSNKR